MRPIALRLAMFAAGVLALSGCASAPVVVTHPTLFCAQATFTHNNFMVQGLACRTEEDTSKAIDAQTQRQLQKELEPKNDQPQPHQDGGVRRNGA